MKGLYLFILCVLGFQLSAQNLKPQELVNINHEKGHDFTTIELLNKLPNTRRANLPNEVKEYDLFSVNENSVQKILNSNLDYLTINIPSANRSELTLELVAVNLGETRITEAPSNIPIKYYAGKHFRGIVKGQEKSIVALSIFEEEIMGLISGIAEASNLVIGNLKDSDQLIIYNDPEVMSDLGLNCETEDSDTSYSEDELRDHGIDTRASSDCVGLYFEIDNDIVIDKGGATGATNYVTGLYNQVATLYANENINTTLSEVVVWTQTSPYNSTSSIGMLNDFTAYRNGFNGDLAMLLSYQASGGVAYVNGLCRSNPDYSMGFSSIATNYATVPTYSWSVMVVTHEFGHLFGSQHTHACVWNGNNTAIDGCYSTEGSCPNPGIPSNGGTVMSYCHLTNAGINLNNGFGPQPGNVIRSRVASASCTSACNEDDGDGGNTCTDAEVTLNILTDNYPGETTWSVLDNTGQILYSGGPYSSRGNNYTVIMCLPQGCYDFIINDSYGDGICCGYGQGSYAITENGNTLVSGGEFTAAATENFCVTINNNDPTCNDGVQNGDESGIDCGGSCQPCSTCNDGIQNGNESGVDCGGDCAPCNTCDDGILNGDETDIDCGGTCPPCSSCQDGIQNGNETGIDCGGDCAPCASCDDGIQNGNESGVDCGGDCAPCETGEYTIINGFFESGWDGWQDGGSDCYRYYGPYSSEGNYSIRLRDNSGPGSTMTSPTFSVEEYDQFIVKFRFYPRSMEPGEDFTLNYYNGQSWTVLARGISGSNFNNNIYYIAEVPVTRNDVSFVGNARLSFNCDASTNSDQVYIDAVEVIGINGSTSLIEDKFLVTPLAQNNTLDQLGLEIYPNPAINTLNIRVTLDEEEKTYNQVTIFSTTGALLKNISLTQDHEDIQIDISDLMAGIYFLQLTSEEEEPLSKKFQILR